MPTKSAHAKRATAGRPKGGARLLKAAAPKRSSGRPKGAKNSVGKETIIAAACDLLTRLPPTRVTMSAVARYAKVDPKLVRYYFKNRDVLLCATAESLMDFSKQKIDAFIAQSDGSPEQRLEARVRALLDMQMKYPFFHRLFVEEIIPSKSAEAKSVVDRTIGVILTEYGKIAGAEDSEPKLEQVFLWSAVVGLVEAYTPLFPVMKKIFAGNLERTELSKRYGDYVMRLLLPAAKR